MLRLPSPTSLVPHLMAILIAGVWSTGTASAGYIYSFEGITANKLADVSTGEAQLEVEVSDAGNNQVSFRFTNKGPKASSITDVYFDDGTLLLSTASITDTARKLVFCRLGDRIRVAGIADINDWDTAPDPQRFDRFLQLARESLPAAAAWDHISHRWAGLRPSTPDSRPVITRLRDGLTCNAGHGMLGWTLAMGSGERAVALALGKEVDAC